MRATAARGRSSKQQMVRLERAMAELWQQKRTLRAEMEQNSLRAAIQVLGQELPSWEEWWRMKQCGETQFAAEDLELVPIGLTREVEPEMEDEWERIKVPVKTLRGKSVELTVHIHTTVAELK